MIKVKKIFLDFIHQPNFKKYFLFTYLTYLIGILSILFANVLYKTDYDRACGLEGDFTNWRHTGRFLNDILTYVFSFLGTAVDTSPLSQLMAIFFLSIGSLILVKVIAHKISYRACFVATILGLSPYYLQIINYTFDSVYYSFSVLLSLIPFLFFHDKRNFYLISCICLFLCYMTFQCSVSIYMIMTTYLFFIDYQKNHHFKRIVKEALITFSLFMLILIMSYFIIRYYFQLNSDKTYFRQTFRQSNLCDLNNCLAVFYDNFKHFLRYFGPFSWYHRPLGYAMESVIICYLVYQFLKYKGLKARLLNLTLVLILLPILFLLIAPWTLFFTFIWWNPRIWVGFGVFFAILMIEMTNERQKALKQIFSFCSIALVWGCIIFASHVGNLLKIEHEYEEFKIFTLSQDLAQISEKNIYFKEKTIYSPVLRNMSNKYPILKDIVSGAQVAYDRWYHHLIAFYRPDLKMCSNFHRDFEQIILDNSHHKFIKINKDCLEIDIK